MTTSVNGKAGEQDVVIVAAQGLLLASTVGDGKYVNTYRRTFEDKNGKKHSKAPKIQRLVTPATLQRKRRRAAVKRTRIGKAREEKQEYHKLLVSRLKEARERRSESLAKKRSASQASKQ